jgi:pilus assembly protein CpaE
MSERTRVLLASRSESLLDATAAAIPPGHYIVQRRWMVNGDLDPLNGVDIPPDILVLGVCGDSRQELEALARRSGAKPPLIAISDGLEPAAMRLAMQAGARDFLSLPVAADEIGAALERLEPEVAERSSGRSLTVAFVGAKGGTGATTLAVNVAHLLQTVSRFKTALVDLDLRYGPLYHYLDLKPKRGLIDAASVAHELDGVAIDAYMATHDSGLRVLPSLASAHSKYSELTAEQFLQVLEMTQEGCERLVLDVPSHLEGIAPLALERADRVVVVLQQTLPCLRNAVTLLETLDRQHAISHDRIVLVANRFHKGAAVTIEDMERALGGEEIFRIPNQYQAVAESIEMGIPLHEHAPNAGVTKSLMELEMRVGGRRPERSRNLLARTFATLMRT